MIDPYCSTCREPAQWREGIGVVHARQDGSVIYPDEEDRADHEPDLHAWNRGECSECFQVDRHKLDCSRRYGR